MCSKLTKTISSTLIDFFIVSLLLTLNIISKISVKYNFYKFYAVKLIKCQCCAHIETSQLICTANRLTGFYMRATLALNELNLPKFYATHY